MEFGICSIQGVIEKIRKINKAKLLQIHFDINNHESVKEARSHNSIFLPHSPRASFINSIQSEIEYKDMIRLRHNKQGNILEKEGDDL